jgi:hypothetical protein
VSVRPARSWAALIATATAAAVLAGCSLSAGRSTQSTQVAVATTAPSGGAASGGAGSVAAEVARADRTHEVPTPAPPQQVAGGWRSPTEAIDVFATQYINWNSQNVSARLRTLARVSIGQARAEVTEAASGTESDYQLRQSGIANVGAVEAIAPVIGRRYQYVVVTRERTTATGSNAYQGLAPAWHLALATVTRLTGGLWVLSDWQPEN